MGFTVGVVPQMRRCSRTACGQRAVATLTYVYADQTAVLGPLATFAEPHTYDLCADHAARTTAPRGWEVVRLITDFSDIPDPTDDITAVADAVRSEPAKARHRSDDRGRSDSQPPLFPEPPMSSDVAVGGGRVGRLRVLRDDEPRARDR